jgi:16S rRNA (guanine527-N7)-methyltransferase
MGADTFSDAVAAARWVGQELTRHQLDQLTVFHGLLGSEAVRAGGIGPNEIERLWSRHIGDSLLFGLVLDRAQTCVDVGSGAGLPGIPLAVAYPEIGFDLVDRSGRRCDLIRRMIAVLGLGNCKVVHKDVADVDKNYDALVARAAMPAEKLLIHVKRMIEPGGIALVAHSRTGNTGGPLPAMPDGLTGEYVEVPVDILDSPVNLLRIDSI